MLRSKETYHRLVITSHYDIQNQCTIYEGYDPLTRDHYLADIDDVTLLLIHEKSPIERETLLRQILTNRFKLTSQGASKND